MDIVSACLVGCNCRYDGDNQLRESMLELYKKGKLIPVCPEQLGGLPTPREPAEMRDGKMITITGHDVTEQYNRGANEALELFKQIGAKRAYLKSKSPMCGKAQIYDGSHSGKLKKGHGVFTQMLIDLDIEVESID